MKEAVNILRGDLHLAVSTAFNRGRYVLMTAGGDGRPVEITIDLRERPDDLFDAEPPTAGDELAGALVFEGLNVSGRTGRFKLSDPAPTDDHGASVPAQGEHYRSAEIVGEDNGWAVREPGPRIYEFALQDADNFPGDWTLSHAGIHHAPDIDAATSADWVHVYDRVTRERRTLKRPAPDAVLTGLRDVAADLRRGPGAPVEPPFGCKPAD